MGPSTTKSIALSTALLLMMLSLAACNISGDTEVSSNQDGDADIGLDAADVSGQDDASTDPDVLPAPSCDDGIHNGEETDVDCGGPDCEPCELGKSCETDDDCVSFHCDEGICVESLCAEDECGGEDCPPCEDGEACEEDEDCLSAVCEDDICQEPSCDDGVQNADETDVDCGGPHCPPCDEGQGCVGDNDCGDNLVCGEDDECVCHDPRNADDICADESAQCDEVYDACGEAVDCGGCDGDDVCENNLCVGCNDDDDCTDGVCDAEMQVCVECTSDDNCDGCRSCSDTGFCVSDDDRCDGCERCSSGACVDDDDQCTDGVCNNATCYECVTSDDCGVGVCSNNECVDCTNDDHCPDGVCSNSQCVECTGDSHCDPGEECNDSNQCICPTPSCDDHAECGTVTNACGNETSCGTCTGSFEECSNHQCQCNDERPTDEICGANLVDCGETTDGCDQTIECGDCGGSDVCDDGQCVECIEDDDCSDGFCSAGQCVECMTDSDCSMGFCSTDPCQDTGGGGCTGEQTETCTSYSCESNECVSETTETTSSCDLPEGTSCLTPCPVGQEGECDSSGSCVCVGEADDECSSSFDCSAGQSCCYDTDLGANVCMSDTSGSICMD